MTTRLIGIAIILFSFLGGMLVGKQVVRQEKPAAMQMIKPSPVASASATPKLILSPTVRPSVTPAKILSLPKATLAPKR